MDPWRSSPNEDANWNDGHSGAICNACGQSGHTSLNCNNRMNSFEDATEQDQKCFSCGEVGHRKAECPNPREIDCRLCKQPGHMAKDCPEKAPMVCENCHEEGHVRNDCTNARKIDRSNVADVSPAVALAKIVQGASERDVDDVKEGIQEYVKALNGDITYRGLQELFFREKINLWLIASVRPLINVFTNMDLQGNMGKKYTVSYRFSDKPERPVEAGNWPKDNNEILDRLEDAGIVVDNGRSKCYSCGELGHISKHCTQEREERTDRPKISCSNCGLDGHRMRHCPEPRVDKFACRNCDKPGHKSFDCPDPPNLTKMECRKCLENGHMAKDCPKDDNRACHNCGQEGHLSKECDQPRNMDHVTCRNCENTGHISKDCPLPRDYSKVQCTNCEEYGHTKVRCKQLPKDAEDCGSGGNFVDADFARGSSEINVAAAVSVSADGW